MIIFNIHKIFLAGFSGLLLTCAFPKAGIDQAAWFALVPLLFSLAKSDAKEGFRLGFIAGVVHYLTLVYWLVYTMQTYGNLPVYLAVPVLFLLAAYLGLYLGFFSMILTWMNSIVCFAVLPFLWVSLEYIRSFLLSGFPWELLGYSQFKYLPLIQIADIFGVYGVSFLIAFSNGTIFLLLLYIKGKKWQKIVIKKKFVITMSAFFLILLSLTICYGYWRIESIEKTALKSLHTKAALVQGNIDQMVKWDPAFQKTSTQKYIDLSLSAKSDKPELVVWPETAAPFYFLHDIAMTDLVLKGICSTNAYFIVGSPSAFKNNTGYDYYNSAYLITPKGQAAGKYDKVHLVPFGEYVPLKQWLPFVKKIVAQIGDFKTGQKGDVLNTKKYKLGVLICYEIIFADLARAVTQNNAGLLINITNDAWYGTTSAPYQHFSMAVFRAVENKRSLVRSANTGISGFISPTGKILGSTPLFKEAVMTQKIPVLKLKTLYTIYGDIFAITCFIITTLILSIFIYRRKLT